MSAPLPIRLETVKGGRAGISTAGSPRQAFRFAAEELKNGAECVAIELAGGQDGGLLEALAALEGKALPGLVVAVNSGHSCRFPLALLFEAGDVATLAELARLAAGPATPFTRADAIELELPLGDARHFNAQAL